MSNYRTPSNRSKTYRPQGRGPEFMRVGLVPGFLGSASVLGGMLLHETDWFITIRFAVSILAAILVVFAVQGRQTHTPRWAWLTWVVIPLLAAVVVMYNPFADLTSGMHGQAFMVAEVVAAAAVAFAGLFIKTPTPQN